MKLLVKLCLLVSMFIYSAPVVFAQDPNNFIVNSFEADYYLSKNEKNVSQLKVVEEIVATFPDYDQNHGIERALPRTYKEKDLNLKIESVKHRDGTDLEYSSRTQKDNQVLRIGEADKYVRGTQHYVITYSMHSVVTFFEGHDEFYWDTNGDQWAQSFEEVRASLHIPRSISSEQVKDPKCFTGVYGQSATNCQIQDSSTPDGGKVITIASTKKLNPSENMSFVVGFKSGTFAPHKTDPKLVVAFLVAAFTFAVLIPLTVVMLMWRRWKNAGKDPEGRGTIIVQYSVPKELNPVLVDVILNERMQTKAISAVLINLCVNGYAKLYELEKEKRLGSSSEEYEIELLKSPADLQPEEQKVAEMIFGTNSVGTKVNLSTLQNKLYKEARELAVMSYENVTSQQYFETNPEKARSSYLWWGIALIILGLVVSFVFIPFSLIFLGLVLTGIIVLLFSNAMPRRTQKGVDTRDYLLGLGEYMKLAEADRIAFLQAPGTAEKIDVNDTTQLVKLHEKLLPYAILFGIEKQWAKQFAGLYAEGQSPGWYSGHSAFNAVLFANAMSGFNTAATTSFSAPGSSGSSGYSGGGGFSGGGGGGGGGGGW